MLGGTAGWITSADDMITAFESIFTPRFQFISSFDECND